MKSRFRIKRFKRIDSTSSAALRYAHRGAPSGTVFVTDYQTRGHGKFGARWVSPRGKDLLFSLLLRPHLKSSVAPIVTKIACQSVAKVLMKQFRLKATFKRPNDVLVGGRKICGVLVQARSRAQGEVECLVIGIGLNVNSTPDELVPEATSLFEVRGKRASRPLLLEGILKQLNQELESICRDGVHTAR